ncbi:uncharacterized protein DUF2617 [Haloactinopolyspora alba]|uniref:Uncharacterized protein DUF2617 n=1 Tax=Haloactinopolyspora alba TaxID=648780 RepID=A0A2P8EFT6_9ACTN|nr:DUF2617 family protein [Haloactinopolyspora alba]PSL08337.1 uncharacterized protein DUF2617 [Haloactinopolyspora alba]
MLATLDVPYVDTRATDLVWTLGHPVVPALTSVHVPAGPGRGLELRVLGASHQVVLDGPDDQIVETVACLPGQQPHLPEAARRRLGARDYRFRTRVDRLSAAGVRNRARWLRALDADGDGDTVVAAFPADPDAVTALRARSDSARVAWDTWHLYPNSRQIVTTSTEVV